MNTEPERYGELPSLIKMNSTFLECVDRNFDRKSIWLSFALLAIGVFGAIIWFAIFILSTGWNVPDVFMKIILVFAGALLLCVGVVFLVMLFSWSIELIDRNYFGYTHYPIRFNRKNQKVYMFQRNGVVRVVDWSKLDNRMNIGMNEFEIKMSIMSEDGKTELSNLSFPNVNLRELSKLKGMMIPYEMLCPAWGFICRYMEEPEELPHLAQRVKSVLDIADRRVYFEDNALKEIFFLLLFLPLLPLFILRWLAIYTCAIPQWPEDVEAECQIEPNDPYLRDRDHLAAPGTVERPPLPR